MTPGDHVTVAVEKPVAGGRMLARHEGRVLLVAGAIPGEVVDVQVERIQRGTVWASVLQVAERSPDRINATGDVGCGGSVYAHIGYPRQVHLKREIVQDAFARLGRLPLEGPLEVTPSPIDGYRMRARLHVRDGRVGFFREGTHELCAAPSAGQLSADTCDAIAGLEAALVGVPQARVDEIELTENITGSERACHLQLEPGGDPSRLASATSVSAGFCGMSCAAGADARGVILWGEPRVSDTIATRSAAGRVAQTQVSRHARSFFQGNRFLLSSLAEHVAAFVPDGPVVDLYAGVGLFAVTRAAHGGVTVTAVEGDRWAGEDLRQNAAEWRHAISVRRQPVEHLPAALPQSAATTVIVDPPRTGMSREALRLVIGWRAARLVYVSCDVATLARDARAIVDAGHALAHIQCFDLFPNTAHVETVAVFDRR